MSIGVRFVAGCGVAMSLVLAQPLWPAAAQQSGTPAPRGPVLIEMSRITCGDLLTMPSEDAMMTLVWMKGFYDGEKKNTTWDLKTSIENGRRLIQECEKDRSRTVMNSFELLR